MSYLTQYKLSAEDLLRATEMINHISSKYKPALNYELLNMLMRWKSKYKLAIISNTGMVSSYIIKQYLKKLRLLDLFDAIVFSEDILLCKRRYLYIRRFALYIGALIQTGLLCLLKYGL